MATLFQIEARYRRCSGGCNSGQPSPTPGYSGPEILVPPCQGTLGPKHRASTKPPDVQISRSPKPTRQPSLPLETRTMPLRPPASPRLGDALSHCGERSGLAGFWASAGQRVTSRGEGQSGGAVALQAVVGVGGKAEDRCSRRERPSPRNEHPVAGFRDPAAHRVAPRKGRPRDRPLSLTTATEATSGCSGIGPSGGERHLPRKLPGGLFACTLSTGKRTKPVGDLVSRAPFKSGELSVPQATVVIYRSAASLPRRIPLGTAASGLREEKRGPPGNRLKRQAANGRGKIRSQISGKKKAQDVSRPRRAGKPVARGPPPLSRRPAGMSA